MIYADTSFLIAARVRRDTFHEHALSFYEERQEDVWVWSPWQRVESFNSIRQLVRLADPKRRLLAPEAKALIHRLETDVRLGYFTHLEADWRDVLRTANETSAGLAFSVPCRVADLLHVAYAKELAADLFVTFDTDQLQLANETGLKAICPSE